MSQKRINEIKADIKDYEELLTADVPSDEKQMAKEEIADLKAELSELEQKKTPAKKAPARKKRVTKASVKRQKTIADTDADCADAIAEVRKEMKEEAKKDADKRKTVKRKAKKKATPWNTAIYDRQMSFIRLLIRYNKEGKGDITIDKIEGAMFDARKLIKYLIGVSKAKEWHEEAYELLDKHTGKKKEVTKKTPEKAPAKKSSVSKSDDLFEEYDKLPKDIQKLVDELNEVEDYRDTEKILKKMKDKGYTFEYYLDNQPYNLRKLDKTHVFHPGDKYRSDFDYDGMIEFAKNVNPAKQDWTTFQKLYDSMEDVNYHSDASLLWTALQSKKEGKLKDAVRELEAFREHMRKEHK